MVLKVGFSPYTYARVAVMKSKLLKKEDYSKLLKMGYQESIRYLQDIDYKEWENTDLGSPTLVEVAMNENLLRAASKLYRISDKNMKQVIMTYLLRYELENIKLIMRSKIAKADPQDIEKLWYRSFLHYKEHFLKELLSKEDLHSLIKSLPFLDKKFTSTNLFDVENAIDKHYINVLYLFVQDLRGQGKQLAEFILHEIDAANIRTILSLMKDHRTEMGKYLVHSSDLIKLIAKQDSVKDIVLTLKKHHRTTLSGDEDNLLEKLDIDLDICLLKKESKLIMSRMLDANYIIGFLLAKEIEVKNLTILLKGKFLDVKSDQIEQMLVVAK